MGAQRMTRIGDTKCEQCVHYRLIEPYAPTPICGKAKNPKNQACVLAWERCDGRYFEAKR